MQNIVQVMVATTTAFLFPMMVSNSIEVADPLPYTAAQIVEQPTEQEEEGKPLPPLTPVKKTSACNCYNILKENFTDVPSMDAVIASASNELGNVALFMYPATEEWPNGIPHVAMVKGENPDGTIEIEEYNYHRCTHSNRTITRHDKRLIGFTNL
jgi:hypothetical protein